MLHCRQTEFQFAQFLAIIHLRLRKAVKKNTCQPFFIACRVLKNRVLIDRDKKEGIYYDEFDLLENF